MHNSDPPVQQTAKPLHWLLAFLRPERKAILRLLLTSLTATTPRLRRGDRPSPPVHIAAGQSHEIAA